MAIPHFLIRKLYRKGSLRAISDDRVEMVFQNPFMDVTIVNSPKILLNGLRLVQLDPDFPFEGITEENPFYFEKGGIIRVEAKGYLLRGYNRLELFAMTKEFGVVELFVEATVARDEEE